MRCTVTRYTFDRSPALSLALEAGRDGSSARYVPIDAAPEAQRTIPRVYLRQMHAVANSIAEGVTVRAWMQFSPALWERMRD